MKGLYISVVDRESKRFGGVYKKIQSQVGAFQNLDVSMDYIGMKGNAIEFVNTIDKVNLERAKHYIFFRRILKRYSELNNKYDFIYVRYSFANPYMTLLIRKFSRANTKVFVEIPTYPYSDEIKKTTKNKVLLKVDRLLWKLNKNWIDRLVLTNDIKDLFGIKAVNIFNGINIKDISIGIEGALNNSINMIGVANVSRWHGYDRLIKGIADYYKNNDCNKYLVNFYIVGEGPEKNNLEELTTNLNVSKYVKFLGAKFGEELEKIYEDMHIGVSSLALFRAGGGHDPIKSKEYVAKGMPVIIGYEDKALPSELPFVFNVDSDDSNIDIIHIIEKYSMMKLSSKKIAKYAEEKLSWESQIIKVVKAYEELV